MTVGAMYFQHGFSNNHRSTCLFLLFGFSPYSFAVDHSVPTIVPHDPNAVIGQRNELSEVDIERIQIYYCCLNAVS